MEQHGVLWRIPTEDSDDTNPVVPVTVLSLKRQLESQYTKYVLRDSSSFALAKPHAVRGQSKSAIRSRLKKEKKRRLNDGHGIASSASHSEQLSPEQVALRQLVFDTNINTNQAWAYLIRNDSNDRKGLRTNEETKSAEHSQCSCRRPRQWSHESDEEAMVTFTCPHCGKAESVLMPAHSSFLESSIEWPITSSLHQMVKPSVRLVVADPPWPSKSVARAKHYATLPLDVNTYSTLPIGQLLDRSCSGTGCAAASGSSALVAVWVTHNPAVHAFVKDQLFPAWGCEHVATWIWVKVADTGQLCVPLDEDSLSRPQRVPFECILIGHVSCPCRATPSLPRHHCIFSVPSAHSRKPFLGDMLRSHLHDASAVRGLELFARCLHRDWFSWGNEPLKFQAASLFELRHADVQAKAAVDDIDSTGK